MLRLVTARRSSTVGTLALLLAWSAGQLPAKAHEFWIEPDGFVHPAQARISAELKVGQSLAGVSFPFLRERFVSFGITDRAGFHPIKGHEGDLPAIDSAALGPGLNIVSYHSTPDLLRYEDFAVFTAYADLEGLTGAVEAHRRRGLPEKGFGERYTRCAKSLLVSGASGPGERDRPVGLPFELVLGDNPYAGRSDEISVSLSWKGKPAPNVQITVFRAHDDVTSKRLRTDAEGRARVPIDGPGEYLLNAVHLEPLEGDPDAAWSSVWASLTFQIASTGGMTASQEPQP